MSEYFERNKKYTPKWFLGDRVSGFYHKIPFIGTVMNHTLVSEQEGPVVIVDLDLPIKYKDITYTLIRVKPNNLKERK